MPKVDDLLSGPSVGIYYLTVISNLLFYSIKIINYLKIILTLIILKVVFI